MLQQCTHQAIASREKGDRSRAGLSLRTPIFFCSALKDIFQGPPTADRQPPTANHQPPTANRQPPTANRRQPPAVAQYHLCGFCLAHVLTMKQRASP